MIKTLPFDELNTLRDVAAEDVQTYGALSVKPKQMSDFVFDLLIMAYVFGYDAVNETLKTSVKPQTEKEYEAIFKEIAGKTFEQRVYEYSIEGNVENIIRVAETDMVRIYNQAVLDAAHAAQEAARRQKQQEQAQQTAPEEASLDVVFSEEEGDDQGEKETAYDGSPLAKTWVTMLDEKVRDTHQYLEGMTIPLDDEFYTYDGDHAQAPGGFTAAQNNVNCRCQLDISVM